MKDTTIGKLITEDIKLVAFQRVIKDHKTIFRLVDFSFGESFDTDFDNEADLVKAFIDAVAAHKEVK